MKKRVAIFSNIAPLYSRSLWYELSSSGNIDYSFYTSGNGFSGIKTIDINESKNNNERGTLDWYFLKNIFIGNVLIFQSGIISKCIKSKCDAFILYGEMHSISNWISAFICKIRKKPLIFWGHGLYGNEGKIKKLARVSYYKLADCHLVYGNRSRMLMIDSGFKPEKVFTVYNSLDYNTHKKLYEEKNFEDLQELKSKLFPQNPELPVILFIGRLTEEKKVSYLIEAIELCQKKGNKYNCLIVGDGEKLSYLQNMSLNTSVSDLICFYGPSYNEEINSRLIMLSDCCVSPGNVGLTAIHSLSLGTPVITHGNMNNQGPEVEAVLQNKTGLFFQENNVINLSDVIDKMILGKKKKEMEISCTEEVKKLWNPANQAIVFEKAILESLNS